MIRLVEWGTSLGTRQLGEQIRLKAEEVIEREQRVIIDCAEIATMSHSFADELVGRLFMKVGAPDFRSRVKIQNVGPDLAPVLRFVLRNRASETPPQE